MRSRLLAVCTGELSLHRVGRRDVRTAIDKQPRSEAVPVGPLGLAGDTQADRRHHGGPDQALYAYAEHDADHWAQELRRSVPAGCFGENLRVEGVDITGARIGERWRIGEDVEVAVTGPRIPCRVFAAFWEVDDLVARFIAAGRPGAYLRVVRSGTLAAGMPVRVVHRPDHDLTIAEVLRIHVHDRHEASRLVGIDGLAARLRTWAEKRVG